jgi:hypothetical protein
MVRLINRLWAGNWVNHGSSYNIWVNDRQVKASLFVSIKSHAAFSPSILETLYPATISLFSIAYEGVTY